MEWEQEFVTRNLPHPMSLWEGRSSEQAARALTFITREPSGYRACSDSGQHARLCSTQLVCGQPCGLTALLQPGGELRGSSMMGEAAALQVGGATCQDFGIRQGMS